MTSNFFNIISVLPTPSKWWGNWVNDRERRRQFSLFTDGTISLVICSSESVSDGKCASDRETCDNIFYKMFVIAFLSQIVSFFHNFSGVIIEERGRQVSERKRRRCEEGKRKEQRAGGRFAARCGLKKLIGNDSNFNPNLHFLLCRWNWTPSRRPLVSYPSWIIQ